MANSAKQPPGFIYGDLQIGHAEFDGTTNFFEVSLDVPADLWVTELEVQFNPVTNFDQLIGVTAELIPEQGIRTNFSGSTSALDELLDVWQTSDRVGSIILPHPHFVWLLGTANTEPITWKQDTFLYFKAGQSLNIRIGAADIATAPTQGSLDVKIRAKTTIVNYNGSPKRPNSWSPDMAYLTILATPDTSTANQFNWVCPTDLRIYNLRMAHLTAIADDSFYMNDVHMENWNPYDIGTDGAGYTVHPQIYVNQLEDISTDTVQLLNYEKGPFHYHKGESMIFGIQLESTGATRYLFQAEIVPNYNNRCTLNGNVYTTDITASNQEYMVIEIPWDMYIESIETDYVMDFSADTDAFLEIHLIKPADTAGAGVTSIGGSILEWSNTTLNQQTGMLPATIVDSMPIANDFTTQTTDKGSSLEMIMDFAPAGSQIIVNVTSAEAVTGIATMHVRTQVEGRNMVKHRNPSRFTYVSGEQIQNLAELEDN